MNEIIARVDATSIYRIARTVFVDFRSGLPSVGTLSYLCQSRIERMRRSEENRISSTKAIIFLSRSFRFQQIATVRRTRSLVFQIFLWNALSSSILVSGEMRAKTVADR